MDSKDTPKQEEGTEFDDVPPMIRIIDYQPNHDYIFRICLLGDSSVGKTSLLTRYCDGTFKEKYSNTIGVDFRVVTLKCNDTVAKIQIWDTAGQERFKSIAVNYFRTSHGFIFVYDISSRESFKNVVNWMELAFSNNRNASINFLIGNKSDLDNKREVTTREGKDLAKLRGFYFLETSALNSDNVEKMFSCFAFKLIDYFNKNKGMYDEVKKEGPGKENVEEISTKREKEGCC